jgi:hypothetical protein
MILRIMKTVCPTFAFCIALSLMLLPTQCLAEVYEIEIAPKVINLQCGGNDFSVHTNIPCGDVDMGVDAEVCLRIEDNQECNSEDDCCEICSHPSKCDSRGNFVGKFEVEDVVNGLCLNADVGSYRLVLSGTTINGEPFSAQQIEGEELKVIDNVNSCGASDEKEENASDEKGENRFRKLLGCMQECMQE